MTFYEKLSGAIALAALLLSLYSAISTYHEKHIKTKLFVRWIHKTPTKLNVSLLISNMSSRPATLTKIFLKYDDKVIESSWYTARLLTQTVDDVETICWSDVTPINIPPRSSSNPVLSFQNVENFMLTSELTLIYVIDGVEYEENFKVDRILPNSEMLLALDYQLKHN